MADDDTAARREHQRHRVEWLPIDNRRTAPPRRLCLPTGGCRGVAANRLCLSASIGISMYRLTTHAMIGVTTIALDSESFGSTGVGEKNAEVPGTNG